MNLGALVMIDCLGYKGIWERGDPNTILEYFRRTEAQAQQSLGQGIFRHHRSIGIRLRVTFLSDTIVVGADAPNAAALSEGQKGRLIHAGCMVAQRVASALLRMSPPLTVRGCACFGAFEMDDRFLIGPAVDEAAELHERANGAFIWIPPHYAKLIDAEQREAADYLANSSNRDILGYLTHLAEPREIQMVEQKLANLGDAARREINEYLCDLLTAPENDWNMIPYEVPMKGPTPSILCRVISPNERSPAAYYGEIATLYKIAMQSDSQDVKTKLTNTLGFLAYAEARERRMAERWDERTKAINDRFPGV